MLSELKFLLFLLNLIPYHQESFVGFLLHYLYFEYLFEEGTNQWQKVSFVGLQINNIISSMGLRFFLVSLSFSLKK